MITEFPLYPAVYRSTVFSEFPRKVELRLESSFRSASSGSNQTIAKLTDEMFIKILIKRVSMTIINNMCFYNILSRNANPDVFLLEGPTN